MKMELFKKTAIIGVGLMGGSLGMALRNRRLTEKVTGIFRNEEKIKAAQRLGAVDAGTTEFKEGLRGAELVVIGTPVGTSIKVIEEIIPFLEPGCIITDLGSTKLELTEAAERLLPPDIYFVGGHPMTGSEESGVEAANPYLLENAIYVLTAGENTNPGALQAVKLMVEEIGAQSLIMDPEEHDLVVAAVSHLPHLTAVTLVNTIPDIGVDINKALVLAAGGFRDTTRVAMSSPHMWKDICLSNRKMIFKTLKLFKKKIEELEKILNEQNQSRIIGELEKAREIRVSIPKRTRGLLPGIYDLVVLVGDVPGVIGKMATLFGNAGINIKDIEILKNREEEGGSIRFSFSSLEERDRAFKLLGDEGFQVNIR
ncbi:MAG: prephenate dehydrogenase/arogenate dehydrogenase family protein [Firmicutes bacterium HGW-Firmicutes-13]|nr:MAG: prephenate dehydrogenase/arogenate dehydrogenase family protein [Firmicutes bacterium HGW-Firmicutes-13]